MNEFIVFVNLLHGDVLLFYTLKTKKIIALESRLGFFGPPCKNNARKNEGCHLALK